VPEASALAGDEAPLVFEHARHRPLDLGIIV
jgi:hypothetical protein